jgi:hypothetical protein
MGKSIYTPALAAKVCALLAQTGSLRAVCRELKINRATIVQWVVDDVDGFADAYTRAKDIGIDELADDMLDISNTPVMGTETTQKADGSAEVKTADMLGHRKLQIETRRWLAERMAPKKYGLRQGLDMTNSDGSLQMDESTRSARVAQLLALAEQRKGDNADLGDAHGHD